MRDPSLPGAEAERRAREHYVAHGYRILEANGRVAGVEVDLLCRRGDTVVFCEVKEKKGEEFGDPLEMVNPHKQRRLRRAAEAWLAGRPDHDVLVRFDVIAVRNGELERVENAF